MGQAGLHSRCTTEMEGLLEGVRGQVQDLEDRCLAQAVQQRDHAYRLQQDKLMAQVRTTQEQNVCPPRNSKHV
jgi:hypothetical protein